MEINPLMTVMQPVFNGSQQVGMTPVSRPGPIQPSNLSTIGGASSLDEARLYSRENSQQGRNRPSEGGINLRDRQLERLNALEAQVVEEFRAQYYRAIWG